MEINGAVILDTYAEGFISWVSRIIITAERREWAYRAAREATGFASSKIGCPCEAGIEGPLAPEEAPDGRPGVSILIFGEKKQMKLHVAARVSQCVLPVPTCSAYNGFPDAGSRFYTRMHYFGDGYEERCTVGGRRCWKIPTIEGEYVGEERFGTVKGIAGGNFLVMGRDRRQVLAAAEAAAQTIAGMGGVASSFPGGIVASGSKVGCRNYRFPMPASTNDAWCPALAGTVPDSQVPTGVTAVYEIVFNGVDETAIRRAMGEGILAATETGKVTHIGASNFGGRLGEYRFGLHELFR
ncbi:MAG: formylmethanofuran--tetrahydromethanopterin N-formyltransferase [Methanomicrobiales archaeon]|nr:formylmethanofuran--tetrahydromethanopterin N-formyltransferase [Methanomicrobiales archaeon]